MLMLREGPQASSDRATGRSRGAMTRRGPRWLPLPARWQRHHQLPRARPRHVLQFVSPGFDHSGDASRQGAAQGRLTCPGFQAGERLPG